MSIREVLDYEVRSSWLAAQISWAPLQELMGSCIAWKVRRNYDRYQLSLKYADSLKGVSL